MLSEQEKATIVSSWRLVVPIADTAADLFYTRLFELRPDYKSFFKSDLRSQRKKLIQMLSFVVKSLEWSDAQWEDQIPKEDDMFLVVLALGRRHTSIYNIPRASYDTVGQALIWTLQQGLGEAFTPDVQNAWIRVYTLLAKTMQLAGEAESFTNVHFGLKS